MIMCELRERLSSLKEGNEDDLERAVTLGSSEGGGE